MSKATTKKLFSVIFLMVFFSKMVISIAPFIVTHFDPKSVHAAIMQLEIEHHSKSSEGKEVSVKEYLTVTGYSLGLTHTVLVHSTSSGNYDHAKHIQAFYPSVPTPPPNVS